MRLLKKLSDWPIPWFGLGMAGVFLLSLGLHFWGLERFNTLVFDELYYVKFAQKYLTNQTFFDAHPPLGKYAIALSILIGRYLPFGQETVNGLAGTLLSTFSYRWLNALTGSLLPLIVAGIAYQLSHRRSFAFIAALFTTVDGLFLVESRYALINIYLVFFGLLGHWFFLLALERKKVWKWIYLALSGISLGASVSVKWNGLGFLLGIYLIWIFAWIVRWVSRDKPHSAQIPQTGRLWKLTPLQQLTQINLWQVLLNLGVLPFLIYRLIWIPHLQINPEKGFGELHEQLLNFHNQMGSGADVHPYCSKWYTWPLMLRPMVYFYETARDTTEAVPALPPLPPGFGKVIYDVHAMGNPFLGWFSTVAVLLLFGILLQRLWIGVKRWGQKTERNPVYFPQSKELWIGLYLVLNYAANFLPWIKVTRCTFIYLYMSAAIFAFLSLAWLIERWLRSYQPRLRAMGVTAIFLILLAFVFWLPVYLGLPLSAQGFQLRMWFKSWI